MADDGLKAANLRLLGGGDRCPVCGEPARGDVWVCPTCTAIQHRECHRYAGGCSTFGCVHAVPPADDADAAKLAAAKGCEVPARGILPAALVRSNAGLKGLAVLMCLAGLWLVSALLFDRGRDAVEEARLRKQLERGRSSVSVSSGDLDSLLGGLKVTVNVNDENSRVSVETGGSGASHVSTSSFELFGARGHVVVVSP